LSGHKISEDGDSDPHINLLVADVNISTVQVNVGGKKELSFLCLEISPSII